MEHFTTSPSSLSVTEFTRRIKSLLETELPPVWLHGEISNFVRHTSGHLYFSLKDESAQISCVMWRSRTPSLLVTPGDGMQVLLLGQVTVYEKRGVYQIDVVKMIPAGVGQLQLALERLKARLAAEGLFDQAHKKPLPLFPQRIGIVTSPTGAAVRDLVQVARRRMPGIGIVLRPALVQGEGAAADIAAAIAEFNAWGEVDVIIVGRGGGSLEDLWAFNEEIVARAIYASRMPVVSAVGHEIDFTIADFVADLRAPTPSAAAELVVPDAAELRGRLAGIARLLVHTTRRRLALDRMRLQGFRSHHALRRPLDLVRQRRQRLDELEHLCTLALDSRLQRERSHAASLAQRCRDLAPPAVLQRGYALVWRPGERQFLRGTAGLAPGEELLIQFAGDRLSSRIERLYPGRTLREEQTPEE
ncbi:MAG TPA: exodeoxyribonuclease VII large subunit [bacterium]|nr:exodeoxyribonuclease VII large subunit [bacterium]HPR88585.1 exodeoxyribonuclease VII large subunit [bacterium]